jgi:Diguanylate cyclase, GGDEF domain
MLDAASLRKATSVSRLWKYWLVVAAVAAGFVGLTEIKIPLFLEWQTLYEQDPLSFRWFVLGIIFPALSLGAVFIFLIQSRDEQLAEIDEKMKHAITDRANLEILFRDSERMRMLDHITGIPNFECWQADLGKWASEARNEHEFSLILIDIDKLKLLNERSRECADKVLRFFARNTYDSMRRDEEIYKTSEFPAEMYRHYQGGMNFFSLLGVMCTGLSVLSIG